MAHSPHISSPASSEDYLSRAESDYPRNCPPYRSLWTTYWKWKPIYPPAQTSITPDREIRDETQDQVVAPPDKIRASENTRKQRPLPHQLRGPVELHPMLEFKSYGVDPCSLHLDLTFKPEDLMPTELLDSPATKPGIPSMSIVHPLMPWPITVSHEKFAYVTIGEVFFTLLERFQTALYPADGAYIPPEYRKNGGKRVDMLRGQTRVVGLQRCDYGGDIWILITG